MIYIPVFSYIYTFTQDQLLGLAKAVANATAGLVVKAKVLASQITSDPEAQQRVIASVTQTGLCTSQLVACTKVSLT